MRVFSGKRRWLFRRVSKYQKQPPDLFNKKDVLEKDVLPNIYDTGVFL